MEKKRPYRKFNFGIGNYVVMSMWKKSIWKRKDNIENLILALKLCCNKYVEKEYMKKKRPYRKFNFGIRNMFCV